MINTIKIILMTALLFGNLFLVSVSAYYWKTNKEKTARIGFSFLTLLEIANIITIGGSIF
ncbi:MAG: hypothetical protein K2N34_01880 [Lachnospiraceae bacterium]|nr:hypothetical protein [Lachnospiraceae bacterium]